MDGIFVCYYGVKSWWFEDTNLRTIYFLIMLNQNEGMET